MSSVFKTNYCVKIKLSNKNIYLTDLDTDVLIGSIKYKKSRIKIDNVTLDDFGKNNIEMTGFYELNILYEDISNLMEFEIIVASGGNILKNLGTYRCSEVKKDNLGFYLKLKSNLVKFTNIIGNTYSNKCRADLGDTKCKKELFSFSAEYQISNIDSNVVHLTDCQKKMDITTTAMRKLIAKILFLNLKFLIILRIFCTLIQLYRSILDAVEVYFLYLVATRRCQLVATNSIM